MKIIGTNKKGTKILVDKNEAIMVFSKKGVETSIPQPLLQASSEEEAFNYVENNNKSLSIFLEVMSFLDERQDDKTNNEQEVGT
jgi:hypothetical protein